MKKANFSTSACRFCRFYEPEGRRGGSCKMLGVPVESSWSACSFAQPPFTSTLEKLENIFQLPTSTCSDATEKVVAKSIKPSKPDFEGDCSEILLPQAE